MEGEVNGNRPQFGFTTTYPLRYSSSTASKNDQTIYQSHRAISDDLLVSPSRLSLQMLPASSESSGHPRLHPRQRGLTDGQGTGTSINPSRRPPNISLFISNPIWEPITCVCARARARVRVPSVNQPRLNIGNERPGLASEQTQPAF